MLMQRTMTAIVLVALLLALVLWVPEPAFVLVTGLITCLGAWEWGRLSGLLAMASRLLYVAVMTAMLLMLHWLPVLAFPVILLGLGWWLLAILLVLRYQEHRPVYLERPWLMCGGFFVLVPAWQALVLLRSHSDFIFLVSLLVVMVASADIGAYFSGRRYGRRKLAPLVSPNKTWEGLWGGLLLSVTLVAFIIAVFGRDIIAGDPVRQFFFTLGVIPVVMLSVVGDLLESLIKRHQQLKDSGSLLPGHGGVMDRIDSITAAAPAFVFLLVVWGVL